MSQPWRKVKQGKQKPRQALFMTGFVEHHVKMGSVLFAMEILMRIAS